MGLLTGKVALVTGAAHGVGRGHALEISKHGATVIVNDIGGSVTGEGSSREADVVVGIIKERGGEALANYGDVSDEADAQAMIRQAVDTYGKLDAVVNNAGIVRDRAIWNMTPDDFDVVVRVHLRGTFLLSHYVAQYWRELAKAGTPIKGRIVNTTSGAGLQGNFGQSNYAAAKAGIAALTLTNSLELASIGATVNCVGPSGATCISGTVARLDRELREPDEIEGYSDADPSNSSPLVAWLCSDEAQYVTGQVIRAVRDTIYWMKPWYEKQTVSNDRQRWDAEKLGTVVGRDLFEVNARGINF